MTSAILLNADDYGLHASINAAILDLADAARISAASALVNGPNWRHDAPRLARQRGQLALGLHLELTSTMPLSELITRALMGQLSATTIEAAIDKQFAVFEGAIGAPPDIIDGHQHVHALPQIRDCLLSVLARRDPDRRILVRVPADSVQGIVARGAGVAKALAISALAAGFSRTARRHGHAVNDSFAGVSTFDGDAAAVARDFARAATHHKARPLVMCHPGHRVNTETITVPHTRRRAAEFAYLMSGNNATRSIVRIMRGPDGRIDWSSQTGWGSCRTL